MQELKLDSMAALAAWLAAQAIDVGAWGRDGAKRVADLWHELASGDCVLQAAPAVRQIQLVAVRIQRGDDVLLELAQELADGTRRERLILPSEKMRPGEDVLAAARRGLLEELHLAPADVELLPDSYRLRRRQMDSPSYPGLPTVYLIHRLDAIVPGLPDADFWRDNLAFGAGDPVRRQQWGWRAPRRE